MKGYLHLEAKKESSRLEWTARRIPPASTIRIPFHPTFSNVIVKDGAKVTAGELIARAVSSHGINIHAGTSGQITGVVDLSYPEKRFTKAIEICADGKDEKLLDIGTERSGWQNLNPESLLNIIEQSGIMDLDWGMETAAPKISGDLERGCQLLIINACEPEPYLSSDYALSMSHPLEVLKGADILRRAAGAEKAVIAFLDNSMEAAELLKSKIYFLKWNHIEVKIFPAVYPKGLNEILKKDISAQNKNLKISKMSVYNAGTAFAVYEAVVFHKPYYERIITVGGECVAQPKIVWARVGTSVKDLIKYCKGLLREPGKLLAGGPMRGVALASEDIPVSGGVQAILALPKEIAKSETTEACIRCGHCLEVCPEDLSPAMITMAAEQNLIEIAKSLNLKDCVECGNCGYVCPSKRPMTEILRSAKSKT